MPIEVRQIMTPRALRAFVTHGLLDGASEHLLRELAPQVLGAMMKIYQELDRKRGIARLLECSACSAARQLEAERSLRLAGAAAALRQNIGAPLTPAERAELEANLHPARQRLTNAAGSLHGSKAGLCRKGKLLRRC